MLAMKKMVFSLCTLYLFCGLSLTGQFSWQNTELYLTLNQETPVFSSGPMPFDRPWGVSLGGILPLSKHLYFGAEVYHVPEHGANDEHTQPRFQIYRRNRVRTRYYRAGLLAGVSLRELDQLGFQLRLTGQFARLWGNTTVDYFTSHEKDQDQVYFTREFDTPQLIGHLESGWRFRGGLSLRLRWMYGVSLRRLEPVEYTTRYFAAGFFDQITAETRYIQRDFKHRVHGFSLSVGYRF